MANLIPPLNSGPQGMTRARTVIVALGLVASGCAGGGTGLHPAAVSDLLCDNGAALRVAWWPERAEVTYGPQRWTLPLAMSASGARYADGVREVWEHQGVVRVIDGASAPISCRRGR